MHGYVIALYMQYVFTKKVCDFKFYMYGNFAVKS